jgi:hypothetical protein
VTVCLLPKVADLLDHHSIAGGDDIQTHHQKIKVFSRGLFLEVYTASGMTTAIPPPY